MQVFKVLSALILISASFASTAEEISNSPSMVPSNLVFSIDRGDLGIFPLGLDLASNSALSYDLATGTTEVRFANPSGSRYDDPLFCFDFLGNGTVSLRARDANGHLVIGDTPLGLDLSYILNNDEINYRPPSGVQCFFRGTNSGEFGLFGIPPQGDPDAPEGRIFADRFETNDRISIEFVNLAGFRNPGDAVSYQIVVSNAGTSSLSNVAFQELTQVDSNYFDATLTTADWACSAAGGAVCPTASEDPNTLRFSGINLPVDSSLTFQVSRNVRLNSATSSTIDLYAGAVAGGSNLAPYDTDSAEIVIIGTADSTFASPVETIAGVSGAIEVTVLDANLNPVPFVDVTVVEFDGLQITPASAQTSDETGYALFQASTNVAGEYFPQFLANGAGTAIANVVVNAAAPDLVQAEATIDQAVANGADAVIVTVQVADEFGNPVGATEVLVADAAPGTVDITSPEPWTDANGQVQFTATSTVAGAYAASFAAGAAVSSDVPFSFIAGEPAMIAFEQDPSNVAAGATMEPPVLVRVYDANHNWVMSDNSTNVQLRLFQDGVEVNPNLANSTTASGEASFDNLVFAAPGSDFTLFAVAILPNFSAATAMSDTFEVTPSSP